MAKRETKAQAEACADLRKLWDIKAGSTIYTMVTHVARSGMSRDVRVFVVHKGKIQCITSKVAHATGLTLRDRGSWYAIVRGGCGMDLAWDTVYHLSRAMFREPTFDGRDPGYALNHQHL